MQSTCGVERLSMLLEVDVSLPRPVAVIPVTEDVNLQAVEIAYRLRKAGFRESISAKRWT